MGPATPLRRSARPAAPAWIVLCCGLVLVALYGFGPDTLTLPLYAVLVLGTLAATVTGTVRNQRLGERGPWSAMIAAQVAFNAGAVLRVVVPGAAGPGPAVFIPDLLIVPAYGLFAYSLATMLRARRAVEDDPARADASLVGIGAAFAAWIFLLEPLIGGLGGRDVVRTTAAFFPMADVLLLVLVARLVLTDGVRKASLWLLGAASTAMFVGDLFYAVLIHSRDLDNDALRMLDMLYLGAYVAVGSAALHPTMRTLSEPQPVIVRSLGAARTAGIAAALVAPSIIAVVLPPQDLWAGAVRLVLAALLTATIVIRIVRANNSRARAEAATRYRATHDGLTDLPNRELLAETVASWCDRANADGQEISLLFIDLDRFKMVNDNWGHDVGDELLCAVAARLSAAVRSEDLVCRIGGDEFVIALASSSHMALAESLAQRLLDDFAVPFGLSVGSIVITPSIGVARSTGAAEALELIRDADTAMYKAKDAGRNGYAFFDGSLRDRVSRRVALEQALRGALGRGELSVHYQPIIDLGTDQLTGFEALMRWQHPELGTVSPMDFIPIAEDTGLIVASGAWLLAEAADQLAAWIGERRPGQPPLHMSVNISVRQLRDNDLVEIVRRTLGSTGLPPSGLWLEITESGVIEDFETSLVTLRELAALGVVLCIDDFGTGYSSLNYLRRFPSAIVKIDRSFVAGVGDSADDEAIVRTVVLMAHELGQRVVAEGVETVVQRDWLRALGCDMAQGWLYGAPRPAAAQTAWIAAVGADVPGDTAARSTAA